MDDEYLTRDQKAADGEFPKLGWHPANDGTGRLRWSDGRQWTETYKVDNLAAIHAAQTELAAAKVANLEAELAFREAEKALDAAHEAWQGRREKTGFNSYRSVDGTIQRVRAAREALSAAEAERARLF